MLSKINSEDIRVENLSALENCGDLSQLQKIINMTRLWGERDFALVRGGSFVIFDMFKDLLKNNAARDYSKQILAKKIKLNVEGGSQLLTNIMKLWKLYFEESSGVILGGRNNEIIHLGDLEKMQMGAFHRAEVLWKFFGNESNFWEFLSECLDFEGQVPNPPFESDIFLDFMFLEAENRQKIIDLIEGKNAAIQQKLKILRAQLHQILIGQACQKNPAEKLETFLQNWQKLSERQKDQLELFFKYTEKWSARDFEFFLEGVENAKFYFRLDESKIKNPEFAANLRQKLEAGFDGKDKNSDFWSYLKDYWKEQVMPTITDFGAEDKTEKIWTFYENHQKMMHGAMCQILYFWGVVLGEDSGTMKKILQTSEQRFFQKSLQATANPKSCERIIQFASLPAPQRSILKMKISESKSH